MRVILLLFLFVRLLELLGRLPLLASSYADDLLCLPLVLGAVLWCHRRFLRHDDQYILPARHGLLVLIFFAIYFEGLLPRLKASAVADPWDLLMYLAGYLVFEYFLNRPSERVKQNWIPASA